jgi:hypothetical protein
MLDTAKLPTEYLPASIKELLTVLDTPTVYALIAEYGGTRLCVPKIAAKEHELVDLIGFDALVLLCQLFGGGVFDCPRCLKALNVLRDNELLSGKRTGLTLAQLARQYHLTERGVSKALRRVEKQEYEQRVQYSQVDWLMAS